MIEHLVDKLIEKAKSRVDELEVYLVKSKTRSFTIANDRIIESSSTVDMDVGIRGSIGRKTGAIRLNNLPEDPDRILDLLVSVIKSSPEDPYYPGLPVDTKPVKTRLAFDEKIASMSEEEIVEFLEYTMNKLKEPALKHGVDSVVVTEGMLYTATGEVLFANSKGVFRRDEKTGLMTWLVVNTSRAGSSSDYTFTYAKSVFDPREAEKEALESGERALLFFNSTPVESGEYDIVFEPSITGLILSYSLAPAFSGLNILENRSPLKNKIGEKVFGEEVSIIDDPLLHGGTGSRGFDDEGIATYTKRVVDKGVFNIVLHSYYTARRMNTESTGNGLRGHPAAQPLPGFTNLVLEPRSGELEEFVRDVKKGIVVYEVIGYWMSDPFTGNVKATVTHGLLVENGRVVKPVKGVVIGGNIYEWLSQNLGCIGRDNVVVMNTSTPTLWIKNVRVAGK